MNVQHGCEATGAARPFPRRLLVRIAAVVTGLAAIMAGSRGLAAEAQSSTPQTPQIVTSGGTPAPLGPQFDDRIFVDDRSDPNGEVFSLAAAIERRARTASLAAPAVDTAGRVSIAPPMAFLLLRRAGLLDRDDVTTDDLDTLFEETAATFYRGRTAHPEMADAGLRAVIAEQWPSSFGGDVDAFRADYVALLGEVPAAPVRTAGDDANVTGGSAQGLPPLGFLALPWTDGQAWSFNGVHTTTGADDGSPMSSIDASMGWPAWGTSTLNAVVRAALPGVVTVYSSCNVRVTAANGWAINYYHLSTLQVSNGQSVARGAAIGVYADNIAQALCNGGSSTGPHTHLSLLQNGFQHTIDGAVFGGWMIHAGRYSYDSSTSFMWLDRGAVRRYAYQSFVNVPCTLDTTPALGTTVAAATGSLTIAVSAPAECPWELVLPPSASWLHAGSTLIGQGDGSIVVGIDANATSAMRGADLLFGIATIRLDQRAGSVIRVDTPAVAIGPVAARAPASVAAGPLNPGRSAAPAA